MNNKTQIHLDPQQRTDAAVKQLLGSFIHILSANETGVIQDKDTEYLHDFRVAVRRSRSLLAQVADVIPKRTLQQLKNSFHHIGAETTPQRDFDVLLSNFDKYSAPLSLQQKNNLDPIYEILKKRRQEAYQRTCRLLKSTSYQRLKTQVNKYLATPLPAITTLDNAKRPVIETANERIWKCYKRVVKQGNKITDTSSAGDLHTLRKTCKKFRYLIEFFSSLYPESKIKTIIGRLKKFQDILGAQHDLHVHHQFFIDLQLQLHNEGMLSLAIDQALNRIITTLELQQIQSRAKFHEVFIGLTGNHHHKSLKKLFRP